MAKKKKKSSSLSDDTPTFQDAFDNVEDDMEESAEEMPEVASQEQVSNLLNEASVKDSEDVKPAKETQKKAKGQKVRAKDMKFRN